MIDDHCLFATPTASATADDVAELVTKSGFEPLEASPFIARK